MDYDFYDEMLYEQTPEPIEYEEDPYEEVQRENCRAFSDNII